MPILSKRTMDEVSKAYAGEYGLRVYFMDLAGGVRNMPDPLGVLDNARRRRDVALQQSISTGEPYAYHPAPGIMTWVTALEDRRMVHGAAISTEVALADEHGDGESLAYLVAHGMEEDAARAFLGRLPVWSGDAVPEAASRLHETFYQISGWEPMLMHENRLKALQQEQINQAIQDRRRGGGGATLYEFEKERMLLANIRAGDRNAARSILNDMLASIFMSSANLAVLRARTVALMSCLTRAAIEDNPLLEPLIEQNHAWTERLVAAQNFEDLAQCLMSALDEFIDGIYLHGVNRSNLKVRRALNYLNVHYAERIALADVAREVGLSVCRLSHLVKAHTGRTVMQHVQQVRVRHAQHLLTRTDRSCTDIAYDVGYHDQSYFIRHFKRITGTTPSRYRAGARADSAAATAPEN